MLENYGKAFIESDKPIFGIVQGQVTGIAFTVLALYDQIFATEDALFKAPFVRLGLGPELCASYTFPKIFGDKVAKQIIVKGLQVNSQFLENYGFCISCKDIKEATVKLNNQIEQINSLDWMSYRQCRRLMRGYLIPILLKVNRIECDNVIKRWQNPDLPMVIMNYLQKQKEQALQKKRSKL